MTEFSTKSFDVLDAICKEHYGREDQVTAVLDANPGLAAFGPVLPAGLTIVLPDLPKPDTAPKIRLY